MARTNVKILTSAIVCSESVFEGDITIGPKTVIHPKVKIIARHGPIIIGENNIIEEQTCIINEHIDRNSRDVEPLIIGNNNVFEVGSEIRALKIGDSNVFEAKSFVGRQTEVSSGCTVAAKCRLDGSERLPENTVLYGRSQRRLAGERPQAQTLQLDFLAKIIPNYHFLKRPNTTVVTDQGK